MTIDYYNRAGERIDEEEWIKLQTDFETNFRIDSTYIGNIHVSTVLLGIDLYQSTPPMLFETMIFGKESDLLWRYCTEEAAQRGHLRIVEWVYQGCPEPPPRVAMT